MAGQQVAMGINKRSILKALGLGARESGPTEKRYVKYLAKAFRYIRPYWRLAAGTILITFLTVFASLLSPWPLQILIDNVLENHPAPSFLTNILGELVNNRSALLIFAIIAGLFVTLMENLFGVCDEYLQTKLHLRMILDVRSDLFQHAQRMSMAFHDQRRSGKLIFAINNQGGAVADIIQSVQPLLQNILTLVGMLWITFHIDAQLALLSLLVVPFLYYSVGYYSRRILPRLREVKSMEAQSLSLIHEAISMLKVIVAFGREDYEYGRFRSQGEKAVDARVKVTVGQMLFSTAVNVTTAIGTSLVLAFGAYRVLQGQISVGELLVVMTYIASVYKPLEAISHTISSLQERMVSLEIIFGLLDKDPEIKDKPGAVSIDRAKGQIAFDKVDFSYQNRKDTLNDISFEAHAGQVVALVGQTGAGKTTLISLIPRFYDPIQGRILLDGVDIRDLTLESLRKQISIVLQEPLLFSGTIADNIRYGRLDATMDEIVEAAKAANVHDFIMGLSNQYETEIGERGAQLSGGERQRISVARAFLKNAPILILDEPTSSIDSKTEAVILEAFDGLMVGRT
ncbi:MAG: ABC transporter ATP-binding protein/permease, partial [Acidobacteriota bacterium]|nr:ABC transporter ATP-binding protein/permease [Acidobacteriota bacterium]